MQLQAKHARTPSGKRVNYDTFHIPHPFLPPWEQLARAHLPAPSVNNAAQEAPPPADPSFFVLRRLDLLPSEEQPSPAPGQQVQWRPKQASAPSLPRWLHSQGARWMACVRVSCHTALCLCALFVFSLVGVQMPCCCV